MCLLKKTINCQIAPLNLQYPGSCSLLHKSTVDKKHSYTNKGTVTNLKTDKARAPDLLINLTDLTWMNKEKSKRKKIKGKEK